jgi:hypothetical protein
VFAATVWLYVPSMDAVTLPSAGSEKLVSPVVRDLSRAGRGNHDRSISRHAMDDIFARAGALPWELPYVSARSCLAVHAYAPSADRVPDGSMAAEATRAAASEPAGAPQISKAVSW